MAEPTGQSPRQSEPRTLGVLHRVAALSMALGGSVDNDEGNEIPQEIWDALYEEKLMKLAFYGQSGDDSYAVLTDAGSEWLCAQLRGGR